MLTSNGRAFVAAACVLVAAGAVFGYRELVVLGLIAAAALLVAVLWMASRPALRAEREVTPAHVAEGERARARLTITNEGARRSPPLVAAETVVGQRVDVRIPSLAPSAVHVQHYDLPTARRGCHELGQLTISASDPLGLLATQQLAGGEGRLWVHPRTYPVRQLSTGSSQESDGPTSAAAPQGGITFHSLREWKPGDARRLIHWRSTARTRTLMVRHNVLTDAPEMVLVLDTSTAPYDEERFEDATRIVASLAEAAAREHFPATFWTTGGDRGRVDQRGGGLLAVFDRLASVTPSDGDPGIAALSRVAPTHTRGAVLGVVTGTLGRDDARILRRASHAYAAVTLVQVAAPADPPLARIVGVETVTVRDAQDFAARRRVRG